jgi:hypothetical protein
VSGFAAGRRALRRAVAATLILWVLVPMGGAGAREDGGEAGALRAEMFSGPSLARGEEESADAVLFDPKALPSSYQTPYKEQWESARLRIVRPYDRSSYPNNLAAPTVRWEDRENNAWQVTVSVPGNSAPVQTLTNHTWWTPDALTWSAIKASGGKWVELEVRGCRAVGGKRVSKTVSSDTVRFRVSLYSTDPLIVYRLVTPLFSTWKTPDIKYYVVSTGESRMFLPGKDTYCTNCHSFPGSTTVPVEDLNMAIAVRSQVVLENSRRILGLYNFHRREGKALNIDSFFMGWRADGRKVAVTGGHGVLIRSLITLETQEFYVYSADIVIVDPGTLETQPLLGAGEPGLMESFPNWSPDGRTIMFARAEEISGRQYSERRYDLYTVPYSDGKGGKAEPVPGASHNGRSNFAPRYSPNGRWVVFNQCDFGSLVSPTADLFIMSTEPGAVPRRLECNWEYAMDSHHSWSSNGRWLLFASKRDDGIFARLYVTEIDDDGHASPPVELPGQTEAMMCYNVPEFLRYEVVVDPDDVLAKTSHLKK